MPRANTMGEFVPKALRASGKPKSHLKCTLRFETNHQEQVVSSGDQCNNAELMEVLKSIKHEMKERDNQLKLQL